MVQSIYTVRYLHLFPIYLDIPSTVIKISVFLIFFININHPSAMIFVGSLGIFYLSYNAEAQACLYYINIHYLHFSFTEVLKNANT